MKKLALCSILLLSGASIYGIAKNITDRDMTSFYTAIDRRNVSQVQALVKKHANSEFTHAQKKSLVKAAEDARAYALSKVSIFSSGTDFLRMAIWGGIAGGSVGAGVILGAGSRWLSPDLTMPILGACALTWLVGVCKAYKGWTLSYAKEQYKKARTIYDELQNITVHHASHNSHDLHSDVA